MLMLISIFNLEVSCVNQACYIQFVQLRFMPSSPLKNAKGLSFPELPPAFLFGLFICRW
jgi:hypothetical protein